MKIRSDVLVFSVQVFCEVTLCHLVQSELRLYIFLASCKRSFQWWFLSLIHYNLYTLLDPILYAH